MTTAAATQFLPVVASASTRTDALVVSIHDIAPSNRVTVEKIISELAHAGVRVCSLLIVPDYHHQGPFMQDRQFVSWLRDLETDGHEIVVHGYFHERPSRLNESLREKFVTQFYTQREGEFYDLDYDEAFRRITKARDEFRAAGLTPRGFIAPAWLLSAEGERAARDADLEYTTRLTSVRDLRTDETFSARSLVYSVRNGWRRSTSLVWNAALALSLSGNRLARLSVHPLDFFHPAIWRQIIDLLQRMTATRTPTTYRDWIAEQRAQRPA